MPYGSGLALIWIIAVLLGVFDLGCRCVSFVILLSVLRGWNCGAGCLIAGFLGWFGCVFWFGWVYLDCLVWGAMFRVVGDFCIVWLRAMVLWANAVCVAWWFRLLCLVLTFGSLCLMGFRCFWWVCVRLVCVRLVAYCWLVYLFAVKLVGLGICRDLVLVFV